MSVYKRKSGRWAAVISADDTQKGGAQPRISLGSFATRKLAEAAVRKALEARENGVDVAPGAMTVKTLCDRYINDRKVLGRADKTLERYEQLRDLYIVPHLGAIPLGKLKPARIAEWRDLLLERGGAKGKDDQQGRPLSPKSVYHAMTMLGGAFAWATRMGLCTRNPVEAVNTPALPKSGAKAFTSDEVSRLIAVADAGRWGPFVRLALATGARRGELCACSWSDFDEENDTLTIARSLSQTKKGGLAMKSPKTQRGVRTIPLARVAVDALRRQRAIQAADKLAAPRGIYRNDDAIFTDEAGRRYTPMAATSKFERLAKKAGLSSTRLHGLRHSAGTAMIASGVDPVTAASILGHDPAVLLRVYGHVVREVQRTAVDRLGEQLEKLAVNGPANPVFPTDCNRIATVTPLPTKKARGNGLGLVAPTGVEPVSPP